jgi:hypothetical protein
MNEELPGIQEPRKRKRPPRRLSRSSSQIVLVLLAALGLTILALLLFVPVPEESGSGGPPRGARPGVTIGQPQAAAEGKTGSGRDTAENYRPFPTLENLVEDATQRARFRALSPGETVPQGTLVVFRWTDDDGGPWKVMILDNKGRTLREEEVKDPEYTLSSPKPGLYYWTVAREDRIRHVGRVAVR